MKVGIKKKTLKVVKSNAKVEESKLAIELPIEEV